MKLIKYLMVGSLSLISLLTVTSCNDNKDDTTTTGNIYYASPDGKENASNIDIFKVNKNEYRAPHISSKAYRPQTKRHD